MAAAYFHATGGPHPTELRDLILIERFGVEAIKNRSYLGAKELKNMLLAERVYDAYMERDKAQSVVEWDTSNPQKADLLHASYKAAQELGMVD
jgi:hypothetical protein